jgi:quercetin dioxygenase-like cupin family protein
MGDTMIITNNRKNEIVHKIHKVKTNVLYDKTDATVVHITLEPGEKLKPHMTPVEVFFYVLEGDVTIQVGNEKMQVSQDNLVESPANIIHCLFNESEKRVRVLVVKTPKPTTSSKFL